MRNGRERYIIIWSALFLVCVMVTVIMSGIKGVKVGPTTVIGAENEMER